MTLRVRPEPGESFTSLMERLASRNAVPLLPLLAHLDVVERAHFNTLPSGYGLVLPDQTVHRIAHSIGCCDADISATLVARYDQRAIDFSDVDTADPGTVRRACAREWVYGAGSHFCPACLADRPVWNVFWKLPWAFACPRHQLLLVSICPGCGARAGAGRADGRTAPALPTREPIPGHCHAPLPPGDAVPGRQEPCGFPLELAQTDDLSERPELLDAQARVAALVDRAPGVETLATVRRLRSTCALVLATCALDDLGALSPSSEYAWLAFEEHRENTAAERARMVAEGISGLKGPRVRYWQRVPENAALMGAIIPAALRLAGFTDTAEPSRALLAPLVQRARERNSRTVTRIPEWFSFPSDLAGEWAELVASSGARFAVSTPNAGEHAETPLEPRHIPRLIPEDLYRQHLAGLDVGLSETTLRAFGSIALLRTLGVTTWDECGALLGHDMLYTRRLANNAVVKLNRSGKRAAFWERIEAIKEQMEHGELLDYRERERIFADWTLIPAGEWAAIRRRIGLTDDRHGARRRNASVWVWSLLTGRDWREAPALGGWAGETEREVFRRFVSDSLRPLQDELEGYVQSVALSRLGGAEGGSVEQPGDRRMEHSYQVFPSPGF